MIDWETDTDRILTWEHFCKSLFAYVVLVFSAFIFDIVTGGDLAFILGAIGFIAFFLYLTIVQDRYRRKKKAERLRNSDITKNEAEELYLKADEKNLTFINKNLLSKISEKGKENITWRDLQ